MVDRDLPRVFSSRKVAPGMMDGAILSSRHEWQQAYATTDYFCAAPNATAVQAVYRPSQEALSLHRTSMYTVCPSLGFLAQHINYRAVERQGWRGRPQPQRFLEHRRAKHELGHLLARGHHAVAFTPRIKTGMKQHKRGMDKPNGCGSVC